MFAAHNMNVINCSVWCCCCHHQHHHYAIGGAIAIVDVTAVFQTKLIFKHYDLNVRISILPEIKLHIFKREKKGEKGAELLCKQWNSHVFFRFRFRGVDFFFCSVLCARLLESTRAKHLHTYIISTIITEVCVRNAHTCDIKRMRIKSRCKNNRCYDCDRIVYGGQWRWTASFALCAHTFTKRLVVVRSYVHSLART